MKLNKPLLYFTITAILLPGCTAKISDENGTPDVTTLPVRIVSSATAVLRGSTSGGVRNMLCRGVCFSDKEIFSFQDSHNVSVDPAEGEFSVKTYELIPLHTYHMMAFAVLKDGTVVYGEKMDFSTTDFTLPSVRVEEVKDIFATEATLTGSLIDEGDGEPDSFGFVYGAEGSFSSLEIGQEGVSTCAATGEAGAFSATIGGLETATTYCVRAFANTEQGAGYSEIFTFQTPDIKPVIFAPIEVTLNEYTALSIRTAFEQKYDYTIEEFGFCWSKDVKIPSTANGRIEIITDESAFEFDFQDVRAGSVYYVRPYAKTKEIGTSFGPVSRIKVKTYDCHGGMVKIVPDNPVFIGYLGDYENPSLAAKYPGAHDGEFLINQAVGRASSPIPSEANVNPFCIAKYEVTNADFCDFLNAYGSQTVKEGWTYTGKEILLPAYTEIFREDGKWTAPEDRMNCPVVGVSYWGAFTFCEFFGGYLPNEAQWEIAARGNFYSDNPANPMPRYSGSDDILEVAIISSPSQAGSRYSCAPVGTMKPNRLGIYDMSGNAQEITRSGWGNYYANYKDDPITNKNAVVLRGGRAQRGVMNTFQNCSRDSWDIINLPTWTNFVGFRFACDPDDEQ